MLDPIPLSPTLTSLTTPPATRLHLRTLPLHTHEILPSFTLWTFLSLLSPRLSTALFPGTYPNLSPRTRLNWDAHVVSLVQSCVINAAALWVISRDGERWAWGARDRVWGYTGASGMVQAVSAGYFLWDAGVCLWRVDVHGVGAAAHAVAALVVSGLGFRPFCNYYGLNLVLYELSTPFLNIHWFMDKLGMTGSTAQLVNGVALITTFGLSRLVWGTYQCIRMYQDIWEAYTTRGGLPVPSWLAMVYVGATATLSGLNVYWFGRMIKTLRARFEPKKESGKKD